MLGNDAPTEGETFVLDSLTLSLVDDPVAGSVVSADGKTVTVPGEGVYQVNADGTITFTPDPSFVVTTRGVRYTIRDTAGQATSNIYRLIVTAPVTPIARADPASETQVLEPIRLKSVADAALANNTSAFSSGYGPVFAPVFGPDGTLYSVRVDMYSQTAPISVIRSVDNGRTWSEVGPVPAIGESGMTFAGARGTSNLALAFDQSLYLSSNSGASWTENTAFTTALQANGYESISISLGSESEAIQLSQDGQVIAVRVERNNPTTFEIERATLLSRDAG